MSAAPPSPAATQPMVETMTGPIRTADLGFVLMHEHIIVRSKGLAQNFPHIWIRNRPWTGPWSYLRP